MDDRTASTPTLKLESASRHPGETEVTDASAESARLKLNRLCDPAEVDLLNRWDDRSGVSLLLLLEATLQSTLLPNEIRLGLTLS